MEFDTLLVEKAGQVATVTVNRPESLNALNRAMMADLGEAFGQLGEDDEVRVIVLTGSGDKAFIAGADIAEMSRMDSETAEAFAMLGNGLGDLMETLPKPIIAAVNGFALGGGCELAMCCDFIIASERARFGQPEVNLGLIPGFGGTQRLQRFVGRATARRLIYTGEMVKAAEAKDMGLVTEVVAPENLLDRARDVAWLIAQKGPLAIAAAKKAINDGADAELIEALENEAQLFGSMFDTEDMREGTTAFVEKRTPKFQGK
jgi:enoyl-CoA hydratase